MSIEQLQQRLADLKFSVEETVKELKREQDQSEEDYQAWEDDESEDKGDEPDVIDNDEKINALEDCRDKIDEAISALDGALED